MFTGFPVNHHAAMSEAIDDDVSTVAAQARPRPRPRKRLPSTDQSAITAHTTSLSPVLEATTGESSVAAPFIHEIMVPSVSTPPPTHQAPVIDYFAHRQREALALNRRGFLS